MLVLTRKAEQGIIIKGKDGDIRIVVIGADKGRLRLGIDAPQGYQIVREELLLEIRDANRLAAVGSMNDINRMVGGKDG